MLTLDCFNFLSSCRLMNVTMRNKLVCGRRSLCIGQVSLSYNSPGQDIVSCFITSWLGGGGGV